MAEPAQSRSPGQGACACRCARRGRRAGLDTRADPGVCEGTRIGQRRAVQVRKFVCAGTVEEKIADMIRDKRGLAAKIVGTSEQWLTEMSTTQLRDLFALEPGAVVE